MQNLKLSKLCGFEKIIQRYLLWYLVSHLNHLVLWVMIIWNWLKLILSLTCKISDFAIPNWILFGTRGATSSELTLLLKKFLILGEISLTTINGSSLSSKIFLGYYMIWVKYFFFIFIFLSSNEGSSSRFCLNNGHQRSPFKY